MGGHEKTTSYRSSGPIGEIIVPYAASVIQVVTELYSITRPVVEKVIENIILQKFSVMFDGWTGNKINYMAMFATYKIDQFHQTFIACPPLLQESDLNSQQYEEFITKTLSAYGKATASVVCFIDDSYSDS